MHKIGKQIFKGHVAHIISVLMSLMFSFKATVFTFISLSIFTFWYSIQYLGNINWEVGNLVNVNWEPCNFWL